MLHSMRTVYLERRADIIVCVTSQAQVLASLASPVSTTDLEAPLALRLLLQTAGAGNLKLVPKKLALSVAAATTGMPARYGSSGANWTRGFLRRGQGPCRWAH